MTNPHVSVIIPNYNHAKYLDERIQSVLNQTYQNFELIILDDCSSDNGASKAVIEKYRKNQHVSRIIYNEKNSGSTFKQWHKGLKLAKGELIWIAESDDSCENTLLEKLIQTCVGEHVVFSFCKSVVVDEHDNKAVHRLQKNMKDSFALDGTSFIKQYMCGVNSVVNASSVVFSRENALGLDTQYMNLKGEGDWLFWIELAEKGCVCFVNEALNFFRQHSSNTTKKSVKQGADLIEHKVLYNYLVRRGYFSIFSKVIYRIRFVHLIQRKPFKEKQVFFNLWDKYGIYRALYPFYALIYWTYSCLKRTQR